MQKVKKNDQKIPKKVTEKDIVIDLHKSIFEGFMVNIIHLTASILIIIAIIVFFCLLTLNHVVQQVEKGAEIQTSASNEIISNSNVASDTDRNYDNQSSSADNDIDNSNMDYNTNDDLTVSSPQEKMS